MFKAGDRVKIVFHGPPYPSVCHGTVRALPARGFQAVVSVDEVWNRERHEWKPVTVNAMWIPNRPVVSILARM